MNIAFFLIPKSETVYLPLECTMRQAMEKMEFHRYSVVPIVGTEGEYIGTISEGDLLWKLKNIPGLSIDKTEKVWLKDIPRNFDYKAVTITEQMEDLLLLEVSQNFVPVVDDAGTYIGIIRRREIIQYLAKFILDKEISGTEWITPGVIENPRLSEIYWDEKEKKW